jgi:hypothetical protein
VPMLAFRKDVKHKAAANIKVCEGHVKELGKAQAKADECEKRNARARAEAEAAVAAYASAKNSSSMPAKQVAALAAKEASCTRDAEKAEAELKLAIEKLQSAKEVYEERMAPLIEEMETDDLNRIVDTRRLLKLYVDAQRNALDRYAEHLLVLEESIMAINNAGDIANFVESQKELLASGPPEKGKTPATRRTTVSSASGAGRPSVAQGRTASTIVAGGGAAAAVAATTTTTTTTTAAAAAAASSSATSSLPPPTVSLDDLGGGGSGNSSVSPGPSSSGTGAAAALAGAAIALSVSPSTSSAALPAAASSSDWNPFDAPSSSPAAARPASKSPSQSNFAQNPFGDDPPAAAAPASNPFGDSGAFGSDPFGSPAAAAVAVAAPAIQVTQAEPPKGIRVKALYDYEATAPGEVSFVENDEIHVIEKDESGWWTGKVTRTGETGQFPSNYVE